MLQIEFLCYFIILYFDFRSIYASNFETTKVIIHKPSYSENTNFGYTVAGYKLEKDSW